MSIYDDYDSYLKEAWSFYQNAVSSEGDMKVSLLKKAKQVLYNVPEGYGNRDDLMSRINSML